MSGLPPDEAVPTLEARPVPLEDPARKIPSAFFETIGLFVASPADGFRRVGSGRGLARPLVFYFVVEWITELVALLYGAALASLRIGQAPPEFLDMLPPYLAEALKNQSAFAAASAILAPIKLGIILLVLTLVFHGLLMLVGGARGGFATTVRVVCYAAAARIALLAPICGGFVWVVWSIVLSIVGLARAHRTSYGRAAVAVLVPVVLCCGCLVVLGAAVVYSLSKSGAWR